MISEPMPFELRLAVIITLLSSSVLRAPGPGKTEAVRIHLEAAVAEAASVNDPLLHATLEEVLNTWKIVSCPENVDSWSVLLVSSLRH